MTLGPALAGLPSLWGIALAIGIVGGGLVILSALTADGSLAAAPAFVCAASVLFWWFATGLDNYVPGAAGPHTVAALGLALTKHPLAAGTGALGGLLSTPWPFVALSVWVSLLCGPLLGALSHGARRCPRRSRDRVVRPGRLPGHRLRSCSCPASSPSNASPRCWRRAGPSSRPRSLREIRAAIPAYAAIDDPVILADVTEHVAENHDAFRASLVRGRPVIEQDLAFIGPHAALRARRGVPLADFLHAFRIGHRVIWDAILEFADEDEAGARGSARRRAARDGVHRPREHARRTDLPRGAAAAPGRGRPRPSRPARGPAGRTRADPRALVSPPREPRGSTPRGRACCIAAVPVSPADDELALRSAASALARAAGGALRPLTVVRQDEIVIVRALGADDPRRLTEPVDGAAGSRRHRRPTRDRDEHPVRDDRGPPGRATARRAPRSSRCRPAAG